MSKPVNTCEYQLHEGFWFAGDQLKWQLDLLGKLLDCILPSGRGVDGVALSPCPISSSSVARPAEPPPGTHPNHRT